MLVLTRKKDETIQIGDSVVIKVMSTGREKVKIGIDAPASVRVIRGELAEIMSDSSNRLTDSLTGNKTTVNS